ncbi:extracellular solute-binding protein [Micrococcales bacterium 31B]|nr:extracellular solute-binding protein [Micrococcales bacterium 31B]
MTSPRLSRSAFLKSSAAALGVILVPGLAACGKSSSSAAAGGLRFSWWGADARATLTQQVIDAYVKENPGASVKGESTDWSGYWDKLATYTAGKNSPEIIQMDQAYISEYSARGALLDLTTQASVLPLGDIDESTLKSAQVDGKQFAVPSGVNSMAILVNPAVFEAAGVAVPDGLDWTWSDYREIGIELTAKSPEGTFGVTSGAIEDLWANQLNGGLFDSKGLIVTADTYTKAFTYVKSLIDQKAGPTASIASEQVGIAFDQSLFALGKIGLQPVWSNQISSYAPEVAKTLRLIPVPRQDDGSGESGMYYKNAMSWSVSSQAKDPVAAAKFVNFLVNSEVAAKILKTERGVPANLKVRAAVTPLFEGTDKIIADYVDLVKDRVQPTPELAPKGSSSSQAIVNRAFSDLIFAKQTPAQAAESVISQMQADLKNAS